MKELFRQLCPPLLWRGMQSFKARLASPVPAPAESRRQDLDVYWDPRMAEALEHWGEGTAWNEIRLLLVNCSGKVLDIACGTGKTISLLADLADLEIHGCDISDMLIGKAIERGIARERLTVTDATAMNYLDASFDWGYSIGSLEHFTQDGIVRFLSECSRVVRRATFHMVPVSRSGKNEGWIKPNQSYYNNSSQWWVERCRAVYPQVIALDSAWSDKLSTGMWLVCRKAG
jgi:ubiquinone/menaquinone biosynthesis C-methylase UbiE